MTDEQVKTIREASGEATYKFGYFPRAKYQDLVFYVKGDNGMNRQLFELSDLPANRAMMDALLSTRPAPTDEKALREALKNLEYQISTEGGEEATESALAQAREALAHEAPKDGSAKAMPMESGWLIETKSQPPMWWNGRPKRDGACAWGTANQAVRFVRKVDAETCLLSQGYSLAHNRATEHGWG